MLQGDYQIKYLRQNIFCVNFTILIHNGQNQQWHSWYVLHLSMWVFYFWSFFCLVNEKVRSAFFDCNQSGSGRFIIARIESESMLQNLLISFIAEIVFVKLVQGSGDWRAGFTLFPNWFIDLDLVPAELKADEPAYILFRTDKTTANGYAWLFFAYVPDKSKVRQKMTYSSSRSTLKNACGGMFESEIFGSDPVCFTCLYSFFRKNLARMVLKNGKLLKLLLLLLLKLKKSNNHLYFYIYIYNFFFFRNSILSWINPLMNKLVLQLVWFTVLLLSPILLLLTL